MVDVYVDEDGLSSKLGQQLLYDYGNTTVVSNVSLSSLSVIGKFFFENFKKTEKKTYHYKKKIFY